MPRLSEQVLIPHTADNLFDLVKDVRRYPDFIRWISSMEVNQEHSAVDAYNCVAKAGVHFRGFDETFTTKVTATPSTRQIDVDLVRGPFRRLRNRWLFRAQPDNRTRVHFYLDYEFNNPVLSLLARANSRVAALKIIDAFRTEADKRFEML